jgi:hypothetical protein
MDENFDASKYKHELEAELGNRTENTTKSVSTYSQEYKQFLNEQLGSSITLYSKACKFASKILHPPVNKKDYDQVSNYIKLLHLDISPQSTLSLAYLSAIIIIVLSIIPAVLMLSIYPLMGGLVTAVIVLYVLSKTPEFMFNIWRSKSSDQLVNAVLYMIIYLEHTPNLEQAVYFAAKNLPPPLSLDFIRILWMVESGKYAKISEALEEYINIWKDWNEGFVESVHMLESSLYVSSEERRQEVLERTINIILDSTQHSLMKYAHDVQNPVQAVHMLGIILPVMGLVMLPMVISFLGDVVSVWQIVILYNVILPLSVFMLSRSILQSRPAGVNTSDIYSYYDYKNYQASLKIGNKQFKISPKLTGMAIFLLFITPSIIYFSRLYAQEGNMLIISNNIISVAMSLLIVLGIGFGIASYYYLRVKDLVAQQDFLNKLDKEFSNSIFQLANRLEEGMPIESAFKRVADTMPKTSIATLFNNIYMNLANNQQTLRQAIFDKQNGAVSKVNSSVILGVMSIIVEAAKKSSKAVSFSLITISRFLNSVRNVNERLIDLLAETVASLKSEVKLFIPMISGIVVAMAVLTTNILINLSERLLSIGSVGGTDSQLGFGATLLDIFKIEFLIPSWQFQLIVGIYLIQVILLMSYLLSGITHGSQKVERANTIQKNLFIGTIFYVIITLIMSMMFISMTRGIGNTL